MTSTLRPVPSQIRIAAPEGGVRHPSAIPCEAVRSVSRARLVERWGIVGRGTLAKGEDCLRILMRL